MTFKSINNDSGISEVMGVILITAIVVVASGIVYTMITGYELEQPVIANIDIESVDMSNNQEVVLVHRGGDSFDVSEISIIISVNGETLEKNLIELPSAHPPGFFGPPSGVLHKLSGTTENYGHDNIWDSGDKGGFNIANTTNRELNSGDLLKVTIYHRPSETIITSPKHRI
ncbi:MAG: flagellin (archaellin), FlaG/FlaF family [Candidatus Methanocomedens sp.]|nr:MAG: flagellin (archaellin), FlaG/FlaF family [ANME-2 cluster archaeon]